MRLTHVGEFNRVGRDCEACASTVGRVTFDVGEFHRVGRDHGADHVAAAEAAVGLAIVISIFRNRETLNVDQANLLKL